LRCVWYVAEIAASLENRDGGFVNLVYFKGATLWDYDRIFDRWAYFMSSCWPIKLVSNHLCCAPRTILRLIKPIIHAAVGKSFRARTLTHGVPESEILQVLSEYGIVKTMLPTQMGGLIALDHSEWIDNRRAAELEEIF